MLVWDGVAAEGVEDTGRRIEDHAEQRAGGRAKGMDKPNTLVGGEIRRCCRSARANQAGRRRLVANAAELEFTQAALSLGGEIGREHTGECMQGGEALPAGLAAGQPLQA